MADRRRLFAAVRVDVRDRWLPRLMRVVNAEAITILEWLRPSPRKRSTNTLKKNLTKLNALIGLAACAVPIAGWRRIQEKGRIRCPPGEVGFEINHRQPKKCIQSIGAEAPRSSIKLYSMD